MIEFTRYNFVTGRVMSTGSCRPLDVFMQATNDNEHVFLGERLDGEVWYLPDGIKSARPALPVEAEYTIAADGVDAVQFALPTGSAVVLQPDLEWLSEEEFFFSTETPGTTVFNIRPAFPYRNVDRLVIHAA